MPLLADFAVAAAPFVPVLLGLVILFVVFVAYFILPVSRIQLRNVFICYFGGILFSLFLEHKLEKFLLGTFFDNGLGCASLTVKSVLTIVLFNYVGILRLLFIRWLYFPFNLLDLFPLPLQLLHALYHT